MENSGFNIQDKFVNQVRTNTKSDLIEITEDKLENILLKHLKKISKVDGWFTPVSLFFTILIVLLTSTFNDFLNVEKSVWKAIFIIGLIITLAWSIKAIYQSIRCSKSATINYLIGEIKNHRE
ncbi:MAG: hypothetical protein ACOYLT_10965 [Flavobacterium sp.]|jgi:hypothetical protein|uniref:hypothetical protein n=1 Tax=Flavobacterium sp. TaxID=239 RepID=UPI003BD559B4